MKKYYYWLCSYPLKPGSIVEPGNWGRILSLYNHLDVQLMQRKSKEDLYEQVRKKYYPTKPSRLKTSFVCEKLEDVKDFENATCRLYNIVYEIEVIDNKKPFFRTDWSKMRSDIADKKVLETFAHEYWRGENIIYPEILTLSDIKIIKKIE